MSTLETNLIQPATGTALQVGASGDTITIPSGATIVNSGTATGFGGDNTPAFLAYRSSTNQTLSDYTATKCEFNTELFDSDGCYDHTTNYRFLPTTAGKYHISFFAGYGRGSSNVWYAGVVSIYKNGATVAEQQASTTSDQNYWTQSVSTIVDMNGSSDYVEAFLTVGTSSGTRLVTINLQVNQFSGYKLIGV